MTELPDCTKQVTLINYCLRVIKRNGDISSRDGRQYYTNHMKDMFEELKSKLGSDGFHKLMGGK